MQAHSQMPGTILSLRLGCLEPGGTILSCRLAGLCNYLPELIHLPKLMHLTALVWVHIDSYRCLRTLSWCCMY
jgi:hypothetical protein